MADRPTVQHSLIQPERFHIVDSPIIISERVDSLPLLLAHFNRMDLPALFDRHLGNDDAEGASIGWVATLWLASLLAQSSQRPDHLPIWVEQRSECLRRCIDLAFEPEDFADARLNSVLRLFGQQRVWEQLEAELNQRLRGFGLQPEMLRVLTDVLNEAQVARGTLLARLAQAQHEIAALNHRRRGKYTRIEDLREAAQAIVAAHQLEEILQIQCSEQVMVRSVRRYRGRPKVVRTEREIEVTTTVDDTALMTYSRRLSWWVYATTMPTQALSVTRTLLAYRSAYLIESSDTQLSRSIDTLASLDPQHEDRATGLLRLLTVGVRALALLEYLAQPRDVAALAALEVGGIVRPAEPQPGFTSEHLIGAFSDVTLTIVRESQRTRYHLTPLNPTQQHILQLLGVSAELYTHIGRA